MKKIDLFEMNRTDSGIPYVTAYSEGNPCYTHKVNTMAELFEWSRALSAEKTMVIVADTINKIIPKCPDIYDENEPWIPFAMKWDKMPRKAIVDPKYLIIHWTAGEPSQGGLSGIEQGAANGFTYLFLERGGVLWQGAPTNAGGYHIGKARLDSFSCLGVEVACAGKLEKIGEKYVPWFAKNSDGTINEKRCISETEVIYDNDGPEDDESYQGYYHLYTVPQMDTLMRLSLYFCLELGGSPDRIFGHDAVALPAGRKVDPGFSLGCGMRQWRERVREALGRGETWKRD